MVDIEGKPCLNPLPDLDPSAHLYSLASLHPPLPQNYCSIMDDSPLLPKELDIQSRKLFKALFGTFNHADALQSEYVESRFYFGVLQLTYLQIDSLFYLILF